MNKMVNKLAKTGIILIIGAISGIGALVAAQFAENSKESLANAEKATDRSDEQS